jgi:plastocyanin
MTQNIRYAFILAAAVLMTSCGGYSSPTTPSSDNNNGTPVTIVAGAERLTTTAYSPNPLTVSSGTTVTWTNRDSTTHTATSDSGAFSGNIAPNGQYSFTFQNKGTFTYHCSFHPNMVASVVVQ